MPANSVPGLPQPLDVIAVGAHPDDVEIGCGGTLARLVEQGHRVGVIDLTDGEPTPLSPGPDVRLAESRAAAEALGVQVRVTLDLPNRRLFDSYEARVLLATEFRRYRPKLVLSLGDRTPLASPDHWQAMQITDAAVFYSRLTKWDDYFPNLPPFRIEAYLYYFLGFHTLHIPPAATFISDISTTLNKKLVAIKKYETQFPPAKSDILVQIESMAKHLGRSAGFAAGELLASPRSLGIRDVMSVVSPSAPETAIK